MAGWNRRTRNLFESLANATDLTAAGADESPLGTHFAQYATWANNTVQIAVSVGTSKGAKTNSTAAKGGMALHAQQAGLDVRIYSAVSLPSNVASGTGAHRTGVTVLAQNDNATPANARAVFCGLLVDAGGGNRRWVIATDSNAGLVSTEATVTATSLGSGASITRPFKVTVTGTAVTMVTPDGTLTNNYTGVANLSDWYGIRCVSGASITGAPLVESFDVQAYDSTYTPTNDAWDRTKLLPGFTPILEFGPNSDYLVTAGATPTYDATDSVYGAQSLVQTFNNSTERIEWTPPAALDLSTKGLCLVAKATAPDQFGYVTTTLAADTATGAATVALTSSAGIVKGAGGNGYVDVGAGGPGISFTGISGNNLTGCTWQNATGTYVAGTRIAQHGTIVNLPGTLQIDLAVSSAERTAGNYLSYIGLPICLGTWTTLTFLLTGAAGVEGRSTGTATSAILSNIGYVRLAFTSSQLPFTAASGAYDGPQSATTPSVKWDCLATFTKVAKPTVVFTFDDSHDSDWTTVAPEIEKPRPGFPNGMRATFHTITSNIGTSTFVTRAQYQRLSANGHEVCLHVNNKTHHEAGTAGGDGPLGHYEVINPGGTATDFLAQKTYLNSLGIPGPFCWAYPYGEGNPAFLIPANAAGIKASRTTSGGGFSQASAIVTGSGASADVTGFTTTSMTTRLLTNPPGDIHRIPACGFQTDINAGDALGHRLHERAILTACQQGGTFVAYSHEMYGSGVVVAPTAPGAWNRDQFAEVLNYISDLKTGGNTSGRNGAGNTFPTLTVATLVEAVTGQPPVRAVAESAGVAA